MMEKDGKPPRARRIVVHCARLIMFSSIIALIYSQHHRFMAQQTDQTVADVDLETVKNIFSEAASVSDITLQNQPREVLDEKGKSLGYFIQTSPETDHIIGFSGPTNLLIGFNLQDRIVGIEILSSADTLDHIKRIEAKKEFFKQFSGLTREEAAALYEVDAVTGATLSSMAISESIIQRLGGSKISLRFPNPLTLTEVRKLFAEANSIEQDIKRPSLWHINDNKGTSLGSILRTSPAADNIVGYQGPTEAHIALNNNKQVIGVLLGKSYDNEPYVSYVREDEYFLSLFNNLTLKELAEIDFEKAEVEGTSGATMTSMATAKAVKHSAAEHQKPVVKTIEKKKPLIRFTVYDYATIGIIIFAVLLNATRLKRSKYLRFLFLCILISYLGLMFGNMVSLALLAGWAKSGIAWHIAPGLVLLTATAFVLPIVKGNNLYCTDLCPHGAAQQVLKLRFRPRFRLPKKLARILLLLPAVLLLWSIFVVMLPLSFSLVDIEPFDAWIFYIAGWATVSVAVVGLIASMFIPMAYCRYGCPTGALLKYLRYNSRSDRWGKRDWLALSFVAIAICLRVL